MARFNVGARVVEDTGQSARMVTLTRGGDGKVWSQSGRCFDSDTGEEVDRKRYSGPRRLLEPDSAEANLALADHQARLALRSLREAIADCGRALPGAELRLARDLEAQATRHREAVQTVLHWTLVAEGKMKAS